MIDDKYEYDGCVNADEDGSFSYLYSYIDPFEEATIYLWASIPDELINQYSKVTFYYGFKDGFNDGYALQRNECDYLYSITATK